MEIRWTDETFGHNFPCKQVVIYVSGGEVMCGENPLTNLHRFAAPAEIPAPPLASPTIWVDILRCANSEAQRLAIPKPEQPTCRFSLVTLLGVISYCYSKGVASSADIERELWRSPAFLAQFGPDLPSAQELQHFRRQHRSVILAVIARAHREYWRRENLRNNDTQFARQQAERMVENAVFTDGVEAE